MIFEKKESENRDYSTLIRIKYIKKKEMKVGGLYD